MASEYKAIATLLQDLVRIDSVNLSLVPGAAGRRVSPHLRGLSAGEWFCGVCG